METIPSQDYQHPMEKEDLRHVMGPYLNTTSLLRMRLVSRACRQFAVEELSRRQRTALRDIQWTANPQADPFTRFSLEFKRSAQILKFLEAFGGGKGEEDAGNPGWPFFGKEGVVKFQIDMHDELKYSFNSNVVKFFEKFGAHVAVLMFGGHKKENPVLFRGHLQSVCPTFAQLQAMLTHTPNLKHLWLSAYFPETTIPMEPGTWPELPNLRSLHTYTCLDGMEVSVVEPLILAYGSKLSTLKVVNTTHVPSFDSMDFLNNDGAEQDDTPLPLNNLENLTINNINKFNTRLFAKSDGWSLKNLSISLHDNNGEEEAFDPSNYQEDSRFMWKMIRYSCQTLEHVYLEFYHDWLIYSSLFLLREGAQYDEPWTCPNLKSFKISFMTLCQPLMLSHIFCKRFPNLEHIEFTKWNRDWEERSRSFQVDDGISGYEHFFVPFWERLPALRSVTITSCHDGLIYKHVKG